jgi:hypothetical protein
MAIAIALALIATNFAGTWTGSMTGINIPSKDPAFMVLAQNGNTVTGTIGPDREGQFKITNASIEGDTLSIEAQPGGTLRFVMRLDGDKLDGQVFEDGQLIAAIHFERVKQ